MNAPTTKPSDVLDRVRQLLDEGRPDQALETIQRSGQRSRDVENARGVCLLRLGKCDQAFALFRDLVFPAGSFSIDPQTPIVFRTNYATALLLTGNVMVGQSILAQIEDKQHPAVVKLRSAIKQWKKSLGLFRRLLVPVGIYPDRPVTMDFPPGDLWQV